MKATPIATWLTPLAVLAMAAFAGGAASAQEGLTLGVDADAAGNTATSLGPIDPCVSVGEGDTFDVDLIVTNVEELRGWEVYFSFDESVVTVVDLDVQMFQAANEGSNVFNGSQALGSVSDGLFRMGAVDIGGGPEADSGSGVLARLTLEAVGSGLSPALLPAIDVNDDGTTDLGPSLSNRRFEVIGDTTGDAYFDGTIFQAQIAVGMPCPEAPSPEPTPEETATPTRTATPTATASPTSATSSPAATATATVTPDSSDNNGGGGANTGVIVAFVVGGGLAVVLLAGAAFAIVRRRSP